MMPKVNMQNATRAEIQEFKLMKEMLGKHHAYYNRKRNYPANMDEFEKIATEIEFAHRQKIADMQKTRRVKEMKEKKEEEEKKEEDMRQNAADALLMLRTPPPPKEVVATRRSTRLRRKQENAHA